MSGAVESAVEADEACQANCGTAALDDVKLKKCACKLVQYCGVECQKNHRSHHKKACKKRLAELRDDNLFKEPDESHLGECPICCLPLSLDEGKSKMSGCCSKFICNGCSYANQMREFEAGLEPRCAFCRVPTPKSQEECDKNTMERAKKNCPVAMCQMGQKRYKEGNFETALEYFTKAAELGNADAHFGLSCLYRDGEGVEKDMKRQVYHLEEAAIGGHPSARHNLGIEEWNYCRFERARKHFIIAARLGNQHSLENIKDLYELGFASEQEFVNALRGHQAAVDATKSEQRTKAYEFHNAGK